MNTYLERALEDGYARISGEGRTQKIIYAAIDHAERYSDPEEKVRAEYWAELIYRYGYEPQRIGIEITVPDRTPSDRADLVVFRDDVRKRPYAVVECKKDGISDAEFNQAVEQAFGNGTWTKFRADYVMVVAGSTRRAFDVTNKYGALEREQNIVADLPEQYGKPAEYKYRKGADLDIQAVNKEELIAAIKKCHQSLWGGGRLSPPAAFGELCKLIFVKIYDEKRPRKKGQPYEFQIKTHEPSRLLADRIRALYEEQQKREPDVFTETIRTDDSTLRAIVAHLEGINLNATDLDTKGVAFEQFMDNFFKGDFGQYFYAARDHRLYCEDDATLSRGQGARPCVRIGWVSLVRARRCACGSRRILRRRYCGALSLLARVRGEAPLRHRDKRRDRARRQDEHDPPRRWAHERDRRGRARPL